MVPEGGPRPGELTGRGTMTENPGSQSGSWRHSASGDDPRGRPERGPCLREKDENFMSATSVYRDRRVLVTGAGGFIGSHLVEALVGAGARVRALVRYSSRADAGNLEFLPAEVRGRVEVVARRRPRPAPRPGCLRGAGDGVPPRRADRHPVLVRRPGGVRGRKCGGHAERPGGGAGPSRGSFT